MLLQQRCSVLREETRCRAASPRLNSTLKFRKAVYNDIDQIRKRLLQEKMNPLSLEPANFTVAESDSGSLVAFAQLQRVAAAGDERQPVFEFRSLVVAPECRGQGIGSALLQQMMADCRDDCYLTTLSRTQRFYQAAGFRTLQLSELPQFLWFEFAAGTLVARLAVSDQLVAMCRPRLGSTD